MTRHLPTLSSLGHALACPGSLTLPRPAAASGDAARLGTAIHAWLESVVTRSPARPEDIAAAHQLPDDDAGRLRYLAQHLDLQVPAGAVAERALGYWPDGRVAPAVGGAGRYEDHGQALAGTIDCYWSEPQGLDADGRCPPGDTLWCVDWKTGSDEHVPPTARNWQIRAGALLAARITGARRVMPAIVFVTAADCAAKLARGETYRGSWDAGPALNAAELDQLEADLRRALDGLDGRLVSGPQCDWCASRSVCPQLAAAAVSLARAWGVDAEPGAPLTPDTARELVGVLAAVRRAADAAEDALRAYASTAGPVPLPDGRIWGPAAEEAVSYQAGPTLEALAGVVGPSAAMAAASVTESALRRALAGQPRGAWPRLREQLDARGAIVRRSREVWRRRWPQGAEGEGEG